MGQPQKLGQLAYIVQYDGSNNIVFPANITASSIIKSGGTSIQFLKADGSVDSNSYQGALTLTTTGSSGAATLVGNTLNIPQYTSAGGITTLNTLTATTQTFSVGTSGTDFAISSSTSIHTFNLPVASATNTGKLSSTDWTTFNNKASTADLANYLPLVGGTLTGALSGTSATFTSAIINNGTNSTNGIQVISSLTSSLFTGGIEFLRTTVLAGSKIQPLRDATSGGVGFRFLTTADNTAETNGTYNTALSIINSGLVGIGTSSPSFSSTGTGLNVQTASGDSAYLKVNYSGGNSAEFRTGLDIAGIGNVSNNPFQILTNNTERIRITNGGLVGIGTSSPYQAKLDVSTTSGAAYAASNSNLDQLLIGSAQRGATSYFGLATGSTYILGLGNGVAPSMGIGTFGAANLILATSNTERARITSGGNLLIGTTTDDGAKFQVNGTATFSSSVTTVGNINIQDSSVLNLGYNQGGGATLKYNSNGNLDITPRTGYNTIFTSGNVGIGTSTPNTKCEIFGTLRINTGGFQIGKFGNASNPNISIGLDSPINPIINGWGNSSNQGIMLGTTRNDGYAFTVNTGVTVDANFQPSTYGTYAFVVGGSGNVLIGTTTDNGAKLNVSGSATFTSSVSTDTNLISNNGTLYVSANSGLSYSSRLSTAYNYPYVDTYLDSFAGASYEGRINFRTNSAGGAMSTKMTISNDGAVSIGTNSSEGFLHIVGTGTTFVIGQSGTGAKQLLVGIDSANGTSELQSVWQENSYTRLNLNPTGGPVYAGTVRLDTLSDARVKDNIQPIVGALDKVLAITGKKFHLKDEEEGKIRYGFIAQELEGIVDELVIQTNMTFKKDDLEVENVKSIDNWASSWSALLVEAIKEQQAQIEELKQLIKNK
jgi:hypothetical protein